MGPRVPRQPGSSDGTSPGPAPLDGGHHPALPFLKVGETHTPAEPGLKVAPSAEISSLSEAILTGPCRTAQRPFPLSQSGWISEDTRSCSGGPTRLTQVHLVPGLQSPSPALLCGGAGGLPAAPWELTNRPAGSAAIRGRGDARGGGGKGFLPSGAAAPFTLGWLSA